jgi:inner membrane protein
VDNLTHGLAGALIAELCLQKTPKAWRPSHRVLTYVVSIVANNAPDLDFVVTGLTPGKLGYLLHHRGHTHTIVGALALALLLSFGSALWLRRRQVPNLFNESRALLVLALIGVHVHLLLDFGNNYGVHPLWPLDGRWYYGDLAFIIEPWWWCAAAATLYRLVVTRAARLGLLAVWGLGTFVPWLLPLPIEARVYGTLLGVLLLAPSLLRLSAELRLYVGFAMLASLYAVQFGLRAVAVENVHAELKASPELRVMDIVKAPMPSAPWCWDLIVVALDERTVEPDYVLRFGRASALAALFPAVRCPEVRSSPTAPVTRLLAPSTGTAPVVWDGEYRLAGSAFRDGMAGCFASAFLRYARAPYLTRDARIVGDLRYDRLPELEFTDLELPAADAPCPGWIPAWEAPRRDVLERLQAR